MRYDVLSSLEILSFAVENMKLIELGLRRPMHCMPGRKPVLLFQIGGPGHQCERCQMRSPSKQLDGLAIRDVRRLRQTPVRLRVVRAHLTIPRSSNDRLAPFRVLHQRAPFDPMRESPTVAPALATFLWLETVQLPAMPDQWRHAHQSSIIKGVFPPIELFASTQASRQCASQTSASFSLVFFRPSWSRIALVS